MTPDLALWVIAAALVIIALPTVLVLLGYATLGAILGVYKLYDAVRRAMSDKRGTMTTRERIQTAGLLVLVWTAAALLAWVVV